MVVPQPGHEEARAEPRPGWRGRLHRLTSASSARPAAPAAGGRRRTLIGFAAFGAFWGVWGASLPAVQTHAGAGSASFGFALALIGAGGFVSMRLAGAVLDRLGQRGLPLASVALALAALMPLAAESPGVLAVTLAIVGATSGAFDVAANAEGTRYETVTRQPLMNLAHAFFSAGVVVGSLFTAGERVLSSSLALPFAAAAAALVAAGAVCARLPSAGRGRPRPQRERASRRWPRELLLLGGLCALAFFVENAWQNWAAVHLHRSLHASSAAAAVAPACFAAAAVAGRLSGQWLTRRAARRTLLAAGATLGAAATAAGALSPVAWLALAAIAIAGFGTSVCAPTLISLAGDAASAEARAAAISTVTTVAYLGFLLGPAVVGVVAGATSLRLALAAVAGVAAALAALSLLVLPERASSERTAQSQLSQSRSLS